MNLKEMLISVKCTPTECRKKCRPPPPIGIFFSPPCRPQPPKAAEGGIFDRLGASAPSGPLLDPRLPELTSLGHNLTPPGRVKVKKIAI